MATYNTRYCGKKLSKNLLEMKFMKRSKEFVEKEGLQKDHIQFLDNALATKVAGKNVFFEPSFVVCEDLVFGHMSFNGANPEIEKLMPAENRTRVEHNRPRHEKSRNFGDDFTSKESDQRYSSVVETIGKKFMKKRDRSKTKKKDSDSNEPKLKKRKFMKPKD